MRNPFRTTMPLASTAYAPVPVVVGASDTWAPHPNTVELDDADYPDVLIGPDRGFVGDTTPQAMPSYNPPTSRVLEYQPGYFTEYPSINGDPSTGGSVDLATPRDVGSIPGTVELDYLDGPVTGFGMDNWSGSRGTLRAPNPGSYGPVVGGTDQALIISNAYWQQSFESYSNEASVVANVNSI